jgi:cytochrome c553
MTSRALVVIALAGCAPQSRADGLPESPVKLDRPAVVRFHMQTHLDDLRAVERYLIDGKLADAQANAFMLTKPANDPGLEPFRAQADRLVKSAQALVDARSITDGCRRLAEVTEACALCHLKTQTASVFPEAPPLSPDDGTPSTHLERHKWAVDRMWEAMIAGTDAPWQDGLGVLATTPLPASTVGNASSLATRLQGLANDAISQHGNQTETLDSRTAMYGEMLATCAACHSSMHPQAVSRR